MAVPRLCYRLIVGVNGGRAATPGVPQLIFMGIAPKKSRLSMTAPGYSIGRCCGPSLPSDLEFACLDQWGGAARGAASSRGSWDHPGLHWQQALALHFLARELAGAADTIQSGRAKRQSATDEQG